MMGRARSRRGFGVARTSATIANAREGRDTIRAAHVTLVRQLDAIARMAQAIARTTPGFDGRFERSQTSRSFAAARATAEAFLRDAAPLSEAFVAGGLPPDFLASLRSALTAFDAALKVRRDHTLGRATAAAGAQRAVRDGRSVIHRIDVLVRYHFAKDSDEMVAWLRARQIDGQPAPKPATADPSSTPSALAAPTAASTAVPATGGDFSTTVKPAA